jgi:ABC-type proline/glycine betaine transport system permease subunit
MDAIMRWAERHDWAKLLLFVPTALLIMILGAVVLAVADSWIVIVGFGGMVLCGMFGYWLGNWKWLVIPVLAILAELMVAIPLALAAPNAVEGPVSIVLEAPFVIGFPAWLGAGVGCAVRILRRPSEAGVSGPAAKGR